MLCVWHPSTDEPGHYFAEGKRQLIDSLYGAMIQTAHAGNDAFAAIDKALGKP
ncbi:MAG: hypothetical protein HY067_11140 [Betaproteobacteria bacterium]|nr:hypothetical protein [Betaproteobacteria bacterium]